MAFAASLPMLVSLMFAAHLSPPPVGALAMTAVVSPLTEEVLFRGYLIRQLHRRAGWPFLAAVAASAIVFGLMHLRQAVGSGNVMLVVMQVAITGGGGLFFGWMFVRSRDNVWLPFGMHAFMNLWWALFAVDTLAVGTVTANIGRGLTVVLAIVLVGYVFPLSTTTPAADKPLQPASGSDPPS